MIDEIIKYKYKAWISIVRQGRKWIEQDQGIIELAKYLKQNFGDDICIILDSLTSTLFL